MPKCLFGGSYYKDIRILGSILGSLYFGKLPFKDLGVGCGISGFGSWIEV